MKQFYILLTTLAAPLINVQGFAPHFTQRATSARTFTQLSVSSSALPDVGSMKAGDLRTELQSYGISTKSFFEKSELVDAVKKARAEGKSPKANGKEAPSKSTSKSTESKSTESKSTDRSSSKPRSERLAEEMEKCKSMKVGELKKELQSYGISTKSFFEKSEFVRALAEARVDGVKKTGGEEEVHDASYRDVVMQKMSENQMAALRGRGFIDTKLAR
jgi:hypothetical protein